LAAAAKDEGRGAQVSETKNNFWHAPRYRVFRIGLYFLVLVLLTEIGVRIYFSRAHIIERNPGNTTAAMPYLFDQMAKHKGRKIVFLGSSVVQGYGNCTDGKHFPAIIERMFREQGDKDVRCYNLSSAGNRFGDHFGNMIEAMRYKPDLIVQAVHIKMFSVHASLINPLTHDESVYYFRDEPDYFKNYRKQFRIPDERYRQIWLDFQARKLSATYRYRGLMTFFFTGNYRRPATSASDWIKMEMGWADPLLVEAHRTTHEERNADNLWMIIPEHVVQLNYHHCEAFDFSDENINWATFGDYLAYAETRNVNVMFFLNPINKSFVNQKEFFDWDEVMALYKPRTIKKVLKHHKKVVDAVDKIDSRYFSDLDHLNMNGHEQLAKFMFPQIKRALKKKRR